jgi:hypothetical protein
MIEHHAVSHTRIIRTLHFDVDELLLAISALRQEQSIHLPR